MASKCHSLLVLGAKTLVYGIKPPVTSPKVTSFCLVLVSLPEVLAPPSDDTLCFSLLPNMKEV